MAKRGPKTLICAVCDKSYTYSGPGGVPKTCSDECRRKYRNRVIQAWRDARECPDKYHGSVIGYVNFACDCDECRTAASAYRQGKRHGEDPDEIAARIEVALAKLRQKKLQDA